MKNHVSIPYNEIREEDLKVGRRVHVIWDPNDGKPEATGLITEVRIWNAESRFAGDTGRDIVIHVVDERTGAHREASLADQFIDILTPAESEDH